MGSATSCRVQGVLHPSYAMAHKTSETESFAPSPPLTHCTYRRAFFYASLLKFWAVSVLRESPELLDRLRVSSAHYTSAGEAEIRSGLRERSRNFQEVGEWTDLGIQVLRISGWCSDSARAETLYIEKTLPPVDRNKYVKITDRPGMRRRRGTLPPRRYSEWRGKVPGCLWVMAGPFFQTDVGASCAWT